MKIRAPVKEYDPSDIARNINEFWARTYAYRRVKNSRAGMNKYYVIDGPPFTAGKCHIGLARNKILKDCHTRFMGAQGFNVVDRPGFDMQGLPVEVKVEGALGISYKTQIEELGVERFVNECMDYANGNMETMVQQFKDLGIWMDWDNPYLTSDNSYIESVWWTIKEAHTRNYLEKQKRVTAWCPRCESPLTKGEIRYTEREGHSAYLKIPIKGRRDEYIIVWTTTPWTFAGALAIAVNPNYTYARVAIRQGGRKSTIIVLESQVENVAKIADIEAYEIIESVKGSELGKLAFFHPLMGDIHFHKKAKGESCHKILLLDSVYEGQTGSVYISPGFGTMDNRIGEDFGLPMFSPVDERGLFTTEVGMKYAGQNSDEANNSILADMRTLRFVLKDLKETHKFGHCWRCDSPIIHRATEQWFLKSGDINDALMKSARGVNWAPDCLDRSQYIEKIPKVSDWCISRQRYWGTPLPIWECIADVCAHVEVVGSINELEGANGYSDGMNLHKPWIDSVSIECPKCGGLMKRVPDIIDVWFDSSIASWGQLGYPRRKQAFNELWPGDWACEGQEQVKGWFFNQIFAGIIAFQKIPFRKAFVHGNVLDEKGHRMNVSLSEYSDIKSATDIHGADALRLYMLGLEPCGNVVFNPGHIKNAHRVLNVLWNCYVFSASYMSMDNWQYEDHPANKVKFNLQPEDVWLLSKTESLNYHLKREMENSRPDKAVEYLSDFILEDLSRCYIKIVRERIWKEGESSDKDALFFTLRETLTKLAVMASPFIPFISEYIYQELDGEKLSVCMLPWPEVDATRLSDNSEKLMKHAKNIVKISHRLRQKQGLNQRWPIKKLTISASNEDVANAVRMFENYIKHQVNVKELEIVPENQEWAGQELIVVPNPNIIGKAYKQRESKIARMLKVLPAKEIKPKIEAGEYSLGIEGELIRILPDMVQFITKLPEGVVSIEFTDGIIYLDSNMDDELQAEGYSREIIRRIQQMRNDMELDSEEFIRIRIQLSEKLIEILDAWFEKIADSTHASQMEIVEEIDEEDYIVEWPIKNETVLIGITALNIKKAMNEFTVIKDVDNELALAMVESGITTAEAFQYTEREELLKIPGMSHSKLRKIKEYFETSPEKRITDEQICPLCQGTVDAGSVLCQRCGNSLLDEEELVVEQKYNVFEDEDEVYYEETRTREKIKKSKKKRQAPGEPEDEIIKMATDTAKKVPTPEETITSEIIDGLSIDDEEDKIVATMVPMTVAETSQTEPKETVKPMAEREISEPEPEEIVQPPETPPKKTEAEEPSVIIAPIPIVQREEDAVDEKMNDATSEIIAEMPEETVSEPLMPEVEDTAEQQNESEPEETETGTKTEIINNDEDIAISNMAETFDIKASAAMALYKNGYITPEALYDATEDQLREIKGIGKVTARRIVQIYSKDDTKMCSLCNAIVPANSSTCSRCGEKFANNRNVEIDEIKKPLEKLEELEKKYKGKPSDSELLQAKAMTLSEAGKKDEALKLINESLDISPDDEELLKLREELAPPVEQPKPKKVKPEVVDKSKKEVSKHVPEVIPSHEPEEIVEDEETEEITPSNSKKSADINLIVQEETHAEESPAEPTPSEPEEEKITDASDKILEGEMKLKRSFTYLIPEERSARSYRMFKSSIDNGMPGYCVTRTYPEKIRDRYELGPTPILWLSNVSKEDAVRPKDLEKLSLSLEEFLGKEGGGIILLDGIEYLITNNNFITVLKLIQSLRDQVAINRSILLLSINPSTMDSHQINLLKREVDSVIE
ncbi:MAG: isoleucine--tRNA ligase [Candidatus Thermoplasmatota archaeon]|nr:isoleucine--tRNA ligase [Euryarchaeota archaeon]MBU4031309.1 isoleucine--tRNA ligase [Candidatus Thermoplasmatota archaeon]MBU4144865.1 isoleucine--tRNA ligase [Candidatus Thermoplasmatota archaeon]MBU4592178.1 isoleucine--tRNA ligase [Candidatus Thermoplasmatota archaeon]